MNTWYRHQWWLILLTFTPSLCGQILAPGITFEARLAVATGSQISHVGDLLDATIISPICWQNRIVIPAGARVHGYVEKVVKLGLGVKNRTAELAYRFDRLEFENGKQFPMEAQLIRVDTAREHVDESGVILGVRPIAYLSSASAFYTVPLLFLNPAVGVPVWGVKALIAPSGNAEISLPAGTEITLTLSRAFDASGLPRLSCEIGMLTTSEAAEAQKHLQSYPRLRARAGRHASDAVNLLFFGSRQQIHEAFGAAGWSNAESKSPLTLYRMYNALTRRIGYLRAPMNKLTLDGKRSAFTYQKSLDTIAKRHHVRFWKESSAGDIWLAAATEDIALRFRPIHWTHLTDPAIDKERTKVVNDLAFTGCIKSAALMPLHSTLESSLDNPIQTDHDVAVLRLNSCETPILMAGAKGQAAWRYQQMFSGLASSFRDDVVRSNPAFTAFNTIRFIHWKRKSLAKMQAVRTDAALPGLDWIPEQKTTRSTTEPKPAESANAGGNP